MVACFGICLTVPAALSTIVPAFVGVVAVFFVPPFGGDAGSYTIRIGLTYGRQAPRALPVVPGVQGLRRLATQGHLEEREDFIGKCIGTHFFFVVDRLGFNI